MKISNATKAIAACLVFSGAPAAFPHVVLDEPVALAGSSYKAALRVGHGCEGSPTTAITVLLPAGFQGAKPMPKAGWVVAVKREKLAQPYSSHGRQVTQDVTEISWTAVTRDNWLPDAWFDEFVLRGSLPAEAGPLWFRVLQTCETGRAEWTQLPVAGTSTQGLKSPAVLLEVLPSGPAGHQH
jgi:uncharacterized protein YcnI